MLLPFWNTIANSNIKKYALLVFFPHYFPVLYNHISQSVCNSTTMSNLAFDMTLNQICFREWFCFPSIPSSIKYHWFNGRKPPPLSLFKQNRGLHFSHQRQARLWNGALRYILFLFRWGRGGPHSNRKKILTRSLQLHAPKCGRVCAN